MKNTIKKILKKFVYALLGFWIVLKEEKSIAAYLFISVIFIGIGILTNIGLTEWTIITFTIFVAISIEILNTSLEAAVDAISFQYNIKVKKIKDIAAAATLIVTIGTIIVALLIFIPAIQKVL